MSKIYIKYILSTKKQSDGRTNISGTDETVERMVKSTLNLNITTTVK